MFKSIQWKLIAIFLLLTISVMIVVGTFLLQNISAYYYNDFSNSLDNQVFTEELCDELNSVSSQPDGLDKILELMKVYSIRMGIDSFRNYYVLDSSFNFLGGSGERIEEFEHTDNLILAASGKKGNSVDKSLEIAD